MFVTLTAWVAVIFGGAAALVIEQGFGREVAHKHYIIPLLAGAGAGVCTALIPGHGYWYWHVLIGAVCGIVGWRFYRNLFPIRNGEMTTKTQTPAELGAIILGRYRHPDQWENGAFTGKPELRDKMVLRVEEVRIGEGPFVSGAEARSNAAAILAFAWSKGISRLSIDQGPRPQPYVIVPLRHFENDVLPVLRELNRPNGRSSAS